MTFNLVTEPWVPVLRTDGSSAKVSLQTLFADAPTLARIVGDLPTQSFAILRVALAICHDAIGFHDDADITELLANGLDTDRVLDHLAGHADRFDLFHPSRPFMQVATLRTAKDAVAGLEKLISDVPNGAPFLTTRGGRGLERISAAEAARWLIHAHAFEASGIRSAAVGDPATRSGKGYPIGPGWAGQIGGVVLHGASLAETLTYNLTTTPDDPDDKPVWALDEPHTEQRELQPLEVGPVQLLVWQSRRIRLVGDRDGVTGLVLCQGDKMTPQNRHDVETMTAWRYSIPQTRKLGIPVYMPLKHDPARDGWRGFPALISTDPKKVDGHHATRRPRTLASLAENGEELGVDLDMSMGLEMVGMDYGPQEATVAELYHDRLDFRIGLIGEQAAVVRTMVEDQIALADTCVWELGRMAANVARASGDFDGVEGAQQQATTQAWAALDHEARQWLAGLTPASDIIAARTTWQKAMRRVLEGEANRLARTASPVADRGRATKYGFMTTARAELFLRKALRKQLPLAYPADKEKTVDE